jgi:hypothetical protein
VIGLKSRQLYPWLDWFGDNVVDLSDRHRSSQADHAVNVFFLQRDVTKCGIVGVQS